LIARQSQCQLALCSQGTTRRRWITEPSLRFGSGVGCFPSVAFLKPDFHIGGGHMSALVKERGGPFRVFAALVHDAKLSRLVSPAKGPFWIILRHMIGLTDHQLEIVMGAARRVPVEKRDTFLQRIAAMLALRGRGRFTDTDVADVAQLATLALSSGPIARHKPSESAANAPAPTAGAMPRQFADMVRTQTGKFFRAIAPCF
jgi:hypothetical protein